METDFNNPKLIWRLKVESKSTPGTFHIVEIYDSGDMRCDCKYNEFGKVCSHMMKALIYLRVLVDKIKKLYGERIQKKSDDIVQDKGSEEKRPVQD